MSDLKITRAIGGRAMRLIDEAALINEAETGNWDIDLKELKMILKYVPTIDAAPVMHGEWVTTRTIIHDGELYCSLCGQEALSEYGRHTYIKSNYCPNCGADNRGGEVKQ